MDEREHDWVIVLAAGEGRRLSALTTDARGVSVPKQFCSFGRERPMLQWALDRASAIAPRERIVCVVAREHRAWWERELAELPRENVIVQPRNRGTAAGILLPLVEILKRDSHARVVVMPSDHHVADEATLACALERALDAVAERPERVVMLGITPEEVDTEYGWIKPARREGATHAVERFVEKPCATLAAELLRDGAVWNSFLFAADALTLLDLYQRTLPELCAAFLLDLVLVPREDAIDELYATIASRDFSRDVLERTPSQLALLVVPPCGWSDLGTPARLGRFVEASRGTVARSRAAAVVA